MPLSIFKASSGQMSFSHLPSLWHWLLCLLSFFQNLGDYIEPTQIIQDNIAILRSADQKHKLHLQTLIPPPTMYIYIYIYIYNLFMYIYAYLCFKM